MKTSLSSFYQFLQRCKLKQWLKIFWSNMIIYQCWTISRKRLQKKDRHQRITINWLCANKQCQLRDTNNFYSFSKDNSYLIIRSISLLDIQRNSKTKEKKIIFEENKKKRIKSRFDKFKSNVYSFKVLACLKRILNKNCMSLLYLAIYSNSIILYCQEKCQKTPIHLDLPVGSTDLR